MESAEWIETSLNAAVGMGKMHFSPCFSSFSERTLVAER
jgi:hypothetical protein